MNIFLIGPMGVGKTTIGHHLADSLHLDFIDSDHKIEEQAGVTIPMIFEFEREIGFRRRERSVINELTQINNIVLSTGGGVVLDMNNRQYLKNRGYVIYLCASVDELLERTSHNHNRPLLKTGNPREKITNLLRERHPLYKMTADFTIDTTKKSIRQVIKSILGHLKNEYITS
ncbi:MAG: shikimate kinase [Proteobacteria bacterium]|nr:shikimate kinase [Pseudomonadota bacterium]